MARAKALTIKSGKPALSLPIITESKQEEEEREKRIKESGNTGSGVGSHGSFASSTVEGSRGSMATHKSGDGCVGEGGNDKGVGGDRKDGRHSRHPHGDRTTKRAKIYPFYITTPARSRTVEVAASSYKDLQKWLHAFQSYNVGGVEAKGKKEIIDGWLWKRNPHDKT